MNSVSLSGSLRENVGKKDAKKLRAQGLVPCILYGNGKEVRFYTKSNNFKTIIFTPETFIIDLTINGELYHTILQDIQYHPVTDEILHADFLDVNEEKPITVTLPVRTKGISPGVMRGGRLNMNISKLKVKGFVKDLPDNIIIDISNLGLNEFIKVKDLNIPNITPLVPINTIVVDVRMARQVIEETEEEKTETTEETKTENDAEKK